MRKCPVVSDEVITKAIDGDADAFASIYEMFRGYVYAMAMNKVKDEATAEDIMQDVFVAAMTNLSSFDPSKPIAPWLATITFNLSFNLLKRGKKHRMESLQVLTRDGYEVEAQVLETRPHFNPDKMLQAAEQRLFIMEALDKLPARRKTVCELHLLGEMEVTEIAEELQVTRLTANALLVRGRKQLRQSLAFLVNKEEPSEERLAA